MNRSIDALITLLLGFWWFTITLLLFRTFSMALWLSSKLAIVADSGFWIGQLLCSGTWKPLQRRMTKWLLRSSEM